MRRVPAAAASAAAGLTAIVSLHAMQAPTALVTLPGSTTLPTTKPGGTGPTAPTGPTTSTTQPAPGSSTSAVGSLVQYGYGQLSVKVTASGSRIVDVSVVNLQTAESYSQQLAQQVIPMLRGEVISAQSAQINGISGATYTSQAYAQSLQSALTKLHLK
jgi:uncharacterized protein with FMN-binding domain